MLRRPLVQTPTLLRQGPFTAQFALRSSVQARGPVFARNYARPAGKGPNPLWFVGTVIVGFTSFFFLVKSRRGLGTLITWQ